MNEFDRAAVARTQAWQCVRKDATASYVYMTAIARAFAWLYQPELRAFLYRLSDDDVQRKLLLCGLLPSISTPEKGTDGR